MPGWKTWVETRGETSCVVKRKGRDVVGRQAGF